MFIPPHGSWMESGEGIGVSRAQAEMPAPHLCISNRSNVAKKCLKPDRGLCLALSCRRADAFLSLLISGLDLIGLMEDFDFQHSPFRKHSSAESCQ